ncbi:MAG: hypothetical protein QXQ60_05240 [Thermofilum sp.]
MSEELEFRNEKVLEVVYHEGREGRWPAVIRVLRAPASLAPLLQLQGYTRTGLCWWKRIDPWLGETELVNLLKAARRRGRALHIAVFIEAYFNPDLVLARLWPYLELADMVELNGFNVYMGLKGPDEYYLELGRWGFLAKYYPSWRDDPSHYKDDWWDEYPD